jgi:hypothetical protein
MQIKTTLKFHLTPVRIAIVMPMFIAALFTIAKLWKEARCPTTDQWIKKM